MATLTQCLTAALVRAPTPQTGGMELGRARAVLSVLAGPGRRVAPAAVRRAGARGRRGARAALVRTVLTPLHAAGPVGRLRAGGAGGAHAALSHTGRVQKLARVRAPSAGRRAHHAMQMSARAGRRAAAHGGAVAGNAADVHAKTNPIENKFPKYGVSGASVPNTPAQKATPTTGSAIKASAGAAPTVQLGVGAGLPALHAVGLGGGGVRGAALATQGQHGPDLGGAAPGGRVPRFTAAQAVAMLLGRGSAPYGNTGAGGQAAFGLGGVLGGRGAGPVQAGPYPAGLMAGVLQRGPAGSAAPSCPPDYLQATTHAVGLASAAAPMWATPAPTVQAQITVNATGSTARAIGDELEHRMDTLRMQARQANMGQF